LANAGGLVIKNSAMSVPKARRNAFIFCLRFD
jgi:hypothetical protein